MSTTETIRLSRTEVRGSAGDVIEIPRQLGSVRLLHQIGQGGMGVVWLGRDDLLGREVAVKFLLGAVASEDDPEFATFLEGARAAAALRHPGLTIIHQAGLVENVPYIVMEYIDGPTLAAVLRARPDPRGLTLPAALAAFDGACLAVGELHDRGIIHRDIKPANILFDHDARLVVTDFGLACSRSLTSLGSTAPVSGTPAYMAPEMFDGAVSTRSDVYALGGMLFELLTGALPFEGPPDAVRRAQREDAPPLDRLREREVPEQLVLLVQRSLHKEPIYRHRSAAHLQHALHEACPDATLFSRGRHQLPALIARALGHSVDVDAPSSTQTYYETLEERAARKRSIGPPPPITPATPAIPRSPARDSAPPAPAPTEPAPPGPAPQQLAPSPQTESWAGRIIITLPCARCGYDLRGVPQERACPECGEPMAASLRPDRLLFAPPRWLRRTRLGATVYLWLAAAVLISVPLAVLIIGLVTLAEGNRFTGSVTIAFLAVGVLMQAGGLISTLLMTWREPGDRMRHRSPWALLACLAAIAAPALYWSGSALQAAAHPRIGSALITAASAAVFFWMGALGAHIAALAKRIPDRKLSARSSALLPAAGLLITITTAALVLGLLMPAKAQTKVDDVLGGIVFWKVVLDTAIVIGSGAGLIYLVYIVFAASKQLRWMQSLCTPRERAVGPPAS